MARDIINGVSPRTQETDLPRYKNKKLHKKAENEIHYRAGKTRLNVSAEESCHTVPPSIKYDVAEDSRIKISGPPVSRGMFGLSLVLTALQEDQYRKFPYL